MGGEQGERAGREEGARKGRERGGRKDERERERERESQLRLDDWELRTKVIPNISIYPYVHTYMIIRNLACQRYYAFAPKSPHR